MKPWTGWVIVGPDGEKYLDSLSGLRNHAWEYFLDGCVGLTQAAARRAGYRAVRVTLTPAPRGRTR